MPGARRFRVKDFGYVNASTYGSTTSEPATIAEMQNEIAARGPIVCSMETNDDHNTLGAWHCYEGGVYKSESTASSQQRAQPACFSSDPSRRCRQRRTPSRARTT